MRKFYLFFALLIGISGAAWATDFTPEDGAIYTIRNKKHGTFALYNSGCNNANGTNILSTWAQFDQRSFFIIEGNATNGYTLRFKNEPTRYVMAVTTKDENSNVGTITIDGGEVPDSAKWKIVENETGTWNIIPFEGSRGWNQRGSLGGNNCIGQWGTNDSDDNRWYIQKPSELASAAITARGDYDDSWSGKIGMPTEAGWNAWNTAVTTTASTLEETFSTTNATAFKNAFNALPALLTPSNGLYKIKNVGTSLYLFQTNEGNPKNITLINDGGDNSKYYWKASFDGNVVSLTGSLGQAPSRGGQSAAYSGISSGVVMNTITMEGAPSASASYTKGAFLWPSVHSTKQWNFTVNYTDYNTDTNPYYLTTWTVTDAADQYTFEAVELTDGKQIYTVNVDRSVYNCDANVTFNSDSYAGNKTVNNGGFFILTESQAQAGNFSAENTNGNPYYPATVTIEGTTINVTYTFDTALQASDYVAASEANKVGYPTSTSTVATELKSALETYQDSETSENLSALSTKLTAYSSATSDISMPVDGKAYTFKNVAYDSENRWYLKYVNETTGITLTSNAVEATTFVCRKVGDGQYAFVNNDGKYLAWKGGKEGGNSNKGYVDAYDYVEKSKIDNDSIAYSDWALLTIEKMIATGNVSGSQADLCGYMTIKGRRLKTTSANYFVIKADGNLDQAAAPFFKNNSGTRYSSAFMIEDATYANVVSLKDASRLESGKTIATFSAPFPTVVPENTTAYSVETQNAHNVTEVSTYKVAEAGEAIPANKGVILMGTETQVTMLPRTTETTVVIAEGALGNSAGAAKDITTENSYVLSNQSSLWAFYKVGAGATALPMNKAYLVLPENPASVIRFNLVGTTGLDLVGADNAAAQGKVYDLSGREVKAAAKGLYIVGGKKVIVK